MDLTVKGKSAAVVQDAEAYQRLLDIAARVDAEEGIRQGLEDVRKGNFFQIYRHLYKLASSISSVISR